MFVIAESFSQHEGDVTEPEVVLTLEASGLFPILLGLFRMF